MYFDPHHRGHHRLRRARHPWSAACSPASTAIISARMQGRVGPPHPAALLRRAQASSRRTRAAVNTVEGSLRHLRPRVRHPGRRHLLRRRQPAAVRVRHHALQPVLHPGGVLHPQLPTPRSARPARRCRSWLTSPWCLFMRRGASSWPPGFVRCQRGVRPRRFPPSPSAWLAFLGFLFILTIKLRKSPFDLLHVAPRPPGARARALPPR